MYTPDILVVSLNYIKLFDVCTNIPLGIKIDNLTIYNIKQYHYIYRIWEDSHFLVQE